MNERLTGARAAPAIGVCFWITPNGHQGVTWEMLCGKGQFQRR